MVNEAREDVQRLRRQAHERAHVAFHRQLDCGSGSILNFASNRHLECEILSVYIFREWKSKKRKKKEPTQLEELWWPM